MNKLSKRIVIAAVVLPLGSLTQVGHRVLHERQAEEQEAEAHDELANILR